MYRKLIIVTISALFLYVQLGEALKCYHCETPESCKSPKKITCNVESGNETTQHLAQYFQNVSSAVQDKYNCFRHELKSNTSHVMYKGCIYRDLQACSLKLNATHSNLTRTSCSDCAGDYCNPAGTYSSSMLTIIASMMGVVIVLKSFL